MSFLIDRGLTEQEMAAAFVMSAAAIMLFMRCCDRCGGYLAMSPRNASNCAASI